MNNGKVTGQRSYLARHDPVVLPGALPGTRHPAAGSAL